jgi:hypothetical protein
LRAGTGCPGGGWVFCRAGRDIREDQILPRLAALAILQAEHSHSPHDRKQVSAQVTAPAQAAELIDRLRAADVTLIYDPATQTLRTDTKDSLAVSVG